MFKQVLAVGQGPLHGLGSSMLTGQGRNGESLACISPNVRCQKRCWPPLGGTSPVAWSVPLRQGHCLHTKHFREE